MTSLMYNHYDYDECVVIDPYPGVVKAPTLFLYCYKLKALPNLSVNLTRQWDCLVYLFQC